MLLTIVLELRPTRDASEVLYSSAFAILFDFETAAFEAFFYA